MKYHPPKYNFKWSLGFCFPKASGYWLAVFGNIRKLQTALLEVIGKSESLKHRCKLVLGSANDLNRQKFYSPFFDSSHIINYLILIRMITAMDQLAECAYQS